MQPLENDDASLLIWADWQEDHGDPAMAQEIRDDVLAPPSRAWEYQWRYRGVVGVGGVGVGGGVGVDTRFYPN